MLCPNFKNSGKFYLILMECLQNNPRCLMLLRNYSSCQIEEIIELIT